LGSAAVEAMGWAAQEATGSAAEAGLGLAERVGWEVAAAEVLAAGAVGEGWGEAEAGPHTMQT